MIVVQPATLLDAVQATLFKFHRVLTDRKYRLLFSSSSHRRKPGPKGPSAELIAAIVELKRRNPRFGYMRIAQQISHTFGVEIDKDVVRRVLAGHYRPDDPGATGSSNAIDLTRKLDGFADYYNTHRVHRSLDGTTPARQARVLSPPPASAALHHYAWEEHCRGLFHTPIPA